MPSQFYNHFEYDELSPAWKRYRELWIGDHDTLVNPRWLIVHEFEKQKSIGGDILRQIREERSQYAQLLKPFIHRFISLIFKSGVAVDGAEYAFDGDEIEDVDGEGTSLINFTKQVAENYFLYGKPVVLVDAFGIQAETRLQERELGLRPFMELWSPLELVDWQIKQHADDKGGFEFARFEYSIIEPRMSPEEEPVQRRYSKVLRMIDGRYTIQLYRQPQEEAGAAAQSALNEDTGWEMVDEATVPRLAEIPLSVVSAVPMTRDLEGMIKLKHNLESALDNQLAFQAHQRLIATGPINEDQSTVMNDSGITLLPEGSTVNVIQPSNPEALFRRIEQVFQNMIKIAFFQTRAMSSDSRAVQSAETMRESKEDFIAAAVDAAERIEDVINDAVEHYAMFRGRVRPRDVKGIEIDKSVTIDDAERFVAQLQALAPEINRYPLWKKQTLKKAARMMQLPRIDEIEAEIERERLQPAEDNEPTPRRRRSLVDAQRRGRGPERESDEG